MSAADSEMPKESISNSDCEKTEATLSKEPDQEVLSLLSSGKRNLVCNEIPQAVNQFQEACRLLAEAHGETSLNCGEAYLFYGKALLELARMESGVLGNALQGIAEEDKEEEEASEDQNVSTNDEPEVKMTEEEKEKLSDEIIDAMVEKKDDESTDSENKENIEPSSSAEVDNSDKTAEKSDTAEVQTSDEAKSVETAEGGEAPADEDGSDDEEEEAKSDEEEAVDETTAESADSQDETKKDEDVTNLQLCWEILEVAKGIYSRCDESDGRLKLAECHLKLGEVGLETEQYSQSIEDFQSCLAIRKGVLESDNRLIAEIYYELGLAYSFNSQLNEATESLKNAANVIESRMAKLNKIIEESEDSKKGKEPADPEDSIIKAHKEVKDLQEILPDIMAKIDDIAEERKNTESLRQMIKENVTSELGVELSSTTGFSESANQIPSGDQPSKINDISHLVRKKRKPDEESEEVLKKARCENGSGDSANVTTNGLSNGHHDGLSNGHVGVDKEITGKKVEDVQPMDAAVESSS